MHIPMFTVALFTRAKIWEKPRYPLIDERIKVCAHTMEYYSINKKE